MSLKNLGERTVKFAIFTFVWVTVITWICNVLSKIFAPVTELVKDYFSELFPESEATKEKKQKLCQDYFKLMGQKCLVCGMYVPVADNVCECCGEIFLEHIPDWMKEGRNAQDQQKLVAIKRLRGII